MPDLSALLQRWQPPELPQGIPHGDMPGDRIVINESHIAKANVIFPALASQLADALKTSAARRAVVSVCGGSGVGKSEIASLLSFYLRDQGFGAYTLSGDNYPHRIPLYNDAERLRVFRTSGIRGLLAAGEYDARTAQTLEALMRRGKDSDPSEREAYPWLETFQRAGREGLGGYLGTQNEIDFAELSGILARFHSGADALWLKRMGREESALWYERVDFHTVSVLVVEWTHGNSDLLNGVDIPVFLHSTPKETLEHRRLRARDGAPDSPFTTMVLEIEQGMLRAQAHKAKIIVSKNGELLTREQYRLMEAE